MNVLLQNFIKQSFDDRAGAATGSGNKKASSKVMNISQDNAFDISQNITRPVNQKNLNNDDNQGKKSQNPKNYSMQLNQVVKKILNDSTGKE
jgi:hypothetical protein